LCVSVRTSGHASCLPLLVLTIHGADGIAENGTDISGPRVSISLVHDPARKCLGKLVKINSASMMLLETSKLPKDPHDPQTC
jgi:hypothetical protein